MPRTRSLAWSELKIGVRMIVAVGIAGVLVFSLTGSRGFFWQRYTLKTRFAAGPCITPGSPVRVAGVEVGTVRGIELGGEQVDITFEVNKSVRDRITDQSVATLGSVSLLGQAAVDITPSTKGTPIPDGGSVRAGRPPAQLSDITETASQGIGEITGLVRDVRTGKLMTDPALFNRLNDVTTRLDQVVTKLNDGEGTAGQLLKDKQLYENMNKTVLEFQALLKQIEQDPKKYLNVKVSIF